MEGGVRIGTTEQRDLCIDNLQSFCADAFSYPLCMSCRLCLTWSAP